MQSKEKFSLLRSILKAIGLSVEAIDDIVERIHDFLAGEAETPQRPELMPYLLRDDFLSRAEHSFYLVLRSSIPEDITVCPKVSLGDVFYVGSRDPSLFRAYTNKIDRKHIDFLLCDSKTMRPLMGIELDDKSHQRADRQERDEFVKEVFQVAQLPLLRVPVRPSYPSAEIMQKVEAALKNRFPMQGGPPPGRGSAPYCPKCSIPMQLRTAKSGANAGRQFWGCSNYPKCREILTLEDFPAPDE